MRGFWVYRLVRFWAADLGDGLVEIGWYVSLIYFPNRKHSEILLKWDAKERIMKMPTMSADYVKIVFSHLVSSGF